jgi:hypothetical protein
MFHIRHTARAIYGSLVNAPGPCWCQTCDELYGMETFGTRRWIANIQIWILTKAGDCLPGNRPDPGFTWNHIILSTFSSFQRMVWKHLKITSTWSERRMTASLGAADGDASKQIKANDVKKINLRGTLVSG